jgi:hypothetical protein
MSALDQIIAAYVKNGGNQSAAWKTANPDSKAKPESIHQKASKFFSQVKVRSRIVELHAEVAERLAMDTSLTLETLAGSSVQAFKPTRGANGEVKKTRWAFVSVRRPPPMGYPG